jgi:hypothetical protein
MLGLAVAATRVAAASNRGRAAAGGRALAAGARDAPYAPRQPQQQQQQQQQPQPQQQVSAGTSWGRVALQLVVVEEGPEQGPHGRGEAPSSPAAQGYMERVRDKVEVDPVEASLLTLQAEVQEEMAAALGRVGGLLTTALREMEASHRRYCHVRARFEAAAPRDKEGVELRSELLGRAREFNRARTVAEDRRRDLIVQRQAVGFSWRNQEIVSRSHAPRARARLSTTTSDTLLPASRRCAKPSRCQSPYCEATSPRHSSTSTRSRGPTDRKHRQACR